MSIELIKKVLERTQFLSKGKLSAVRRAYSEAKGPAYRAVTRFQERIRRYGARGGKMTLDIKDPGSAGFAHGRRIAYRKIGQAAKEEGTFPHIAEQARRKERALQPQAMSEIGVARTLTRKEIVDNFIDLANNINKGSFGRIARVAARAFRETTRRGGTTISPKTGKIPTRGYAVSPFKEAERKVPAKDFGRYGGERVRQYIKEQAPKLKGKDRYVGTWSSKPEGKVYLDVSVVKPSKQSAVRIARQSKQQAIYSLHEGKTLPVTRKEIIGNLKDLMCKINRGDNLTEMHELLLSQLIVSPPYKGPEGKPEHPHTYPPQLMGVRQKEQKQRLEGSAHTGSTFGGVTGMYGSVTGGSYRT